MNKERGFLNLVIGINFFVSCYFFFFYPVFIFSVFHSDIAVAANSHILTKYPQKRPSRNTTDLT